MTYTVDGLLPGTTVEFDAGTSLLLTGPSMAVERELLGAVADGVSDGDIGVVITTNRAPDDVVSAVRDGAASTERLGVIDTTGRDAEPNIDGVCVECLASPGDLTGISLEFAKLVRRLREEGGDSGGHVRVGLATVSTMLMYTDVQTAFRFLHVFTSRIRSGGLFGAFAIDPEMHDHQTVNTIRAIFGCEARFTDDGVDLRGSGHSVG